MALGVFNPFRPPLTHPSAKPLGGNAAWIQGVGADHQWNPLTLAALASLWLAGPANWPLWHALLDLPETASAHGALFVCGFFMMVTTIIFGLLTVASLRRTVKPVIALFLLSASLGAHFMGAYGVVIDPTMMVNVLQTDLHETRDLLNARLVVSLLLLAGLPIAWLWQVRIRQRSTGAQLGLNGLSTIGAVFVLATLVFFFSADLASTMRNHKSLRYLINPINSFYSLAALAYNASAKPAGPLQKISMDARVIAQPSGTRPPLLMLVIGETARADNFSLNGYPRLTNPELAQFKVVSFRHVASCGTSTAASLPCMFSHLGRERYLARSADYENLLDVLQHAGLAMLWLDNQAGCKSLCDRVPHADASAAPPGGNPPLATLCSHDECFDAALLNNLDARLAALPAAQRARGVVLVLHQMGSHGPAYALRSPPERKPFLPECTTNVLQQCSREQLLNAFDNSVAYTDHVLAGGIQWLQTQKAFDTTLLYVSDHGESLGENNIYLHGLPYAIAPEYQKHVPWIVWLSPQTEADTHVTLACLQRQRDTELSHDNLFHTVLGVLGVASGEYRAALDVTASCRNSPTPLQAKEGGGPKMPNQVAAPANPRDVAG